jgi:hypothetical protein
MDTGRASSPNHSRLPQDGHGASPGGREGVRTTRSPQIGQSLASPSGVREEMFMSVTTSVAERLRPALRPRPASSARTGCFCFALYLTLRNRQRHARKVFPVRPALETHPDFIILAIPPADKPGMDKPAAARVWTG